MESLKISGVNCMHCVASIKGALDGVPGIEGIDIRLEEKAALVLFDSKTVSRSEVTEKIEEIGFDVEK